MFYATHAGILTPARSNGTFQSAFTARRTLPYYKLSLIPSFGAVLEPRYIIRATAFDQ